MRKKIHLKYSDIVCSLFIALIFCASGCREDVVDDFTPYKTEYIDLSEFYARIDETKEFKISEASNEFVIELENEIVYFPSESFIDDFGTVVVGEIKVLLKEINHNGSLIFSQINSLTASSEILETKFLHEYHFYKDGVEILLNPGNYPTIYASAEVTALNAEASFELIDNNDVLSWFPTADFNVELSSWDFNVAGIQYTGEGYKVKLKHKSFTHLANYQELLHPDFSDYGSIVISINESYNNGNSQVYVSYNNEICLIPLKKIGNEFMYDRILLNREMKVIFLGIVEGEIHYDSKHFISGETNNYSLYPQMYEDIELIQVLRSM